MSGYGSPITFSGMTRGGSETGYAIISPSAGNLKKPHFAAGGQCRALPFDHTHLDARL